MLYMYNLSDELLDSQAPKSFTEYITLKTHYDVSY